VRKQGALTDCQAQGEQVRTQHELKVSKQKALTTYKVPMEEVKMQKQKQSKQRALTLYRAQREQIKTPKEHRQEMCTHPLSSIEVMQSGHEKKGARYKHLQADGQRGTTQVTEIKRVSTRYSLSVESRQRDKSEHEKASEGHSRTVRRRESDTL
jgi:hypothetical protein